MIRTVKIILLSAIQSFTAVLPVSSLGHFSLLKEILGFSEENFNASFYYSAFSLCSFIMMYAFYFRLHKKITACLFKSKKSIKSPKELAFKSAGKNELLSVLPLAVLFIPIGNGRLLESLETYFLSDGSLLFVGLASFFSGILMVISLWYLKQKYAEKEPLLSSKNAFVFGLYQLPAYFLPGISHISMGTSRTAVSDIGIKNILKETFLYIAPAGIIINAFRCVYYGINTEIDWIALSVGSLISLVVTYYMIRLVNRSFSKRSYCTFAVYSLVFGVVLAGVSVYCMFF